MTQPPPPGSTVDPYAPVTWVEPTRRLSFSPRFTYDGRYGAALVSVVLGGYLLLTANISQLVLALGGVGAYPAEQVVLFLTQYLIAVAVLVFGLAIAPATSGRRVIAIVVVLVLLVVWTMIVAARVTGAAGPLPFACRVRRRALVHRAARHGDRLADRARAARGQLLALAAHADRRRAVRSSSCSTTCRRPSAS